ncbi:alpha/beta fold hydrolase [Nevskia ramosa]|uniref:alpha/beta fold hydrolase n=1 Tax=Nevskia ramosa TaxID=64002 RepID=UPI0003B3ED6E|nr:alpha/beta fold hydrolase [Nevskia ramosa]
MADIEIDEHLPAAPRRGVLQLNGRIAGTVANGFDWLFRRDRLIQSGKTWFSLIHDSELMSVRYYGPPDEDSIELPDGSRLPVVRQPYAVPLVLVPPLGVTADTFDLMPQRSLARYMAARGFRTYLIDWGRPTPAHASLGLVDYVDTMMSTALAAIRKHSGSQEVSLFGWCMGGLLSLMHAGLTLDPKIRNLVTVASPIDLRGGGVVAGLAGALDAPARLVRKYSDFRLMGVDPTRLTIPGWLLALGFKMTSPVASVTTYWDLLTRLWDREFVESHSTTSNYLNKMLIYPGGVVRDMVLRMAIDNELAKGSIRIDTRIAELGKIKASALIFAGNRDSIVAPSIARKIVDILPTRDKSWRIATGGHMGVVLGSKAPLEVWGPAADWLAERSLAKPPRKAAAKPRAKKAAPGRGLTS